MQALANLLKQAAKGKVKELVGTCHLAPEASPGLLEREIREFLGVQGLLVDAALAPPALDKTDVAGSFSRAARGYDSRGPPAEGCGRTTTGQPG